MADQHPITPPPELVAQWALGRRYSWNYIATQAARWGADTELAACCEWVSQWRCMVGGSRPEVNLRAARRPKPPSLAEEAQKALAHLLRHSSTELGSETIRRALERLQELEGQGD